MNVRTSAHYNKEQTGPEEEVVSTALTSLTAQTQPRAFNCNNLIIGAELPLAGTRLALQLFLAKGFRLFSFQLPDQKARHCYLLSLPPNGIG